MPTKVKITKEMILDAAFGIVREKGMEGLSNRALADALNCSIRPIYYQFENAENLKQELIKKIEKFFYDTLMSNHNDYMPKFRQLGENYIKFAREESNLFKVLFTEKSELNIDELLFKDEEEFNKIDKIIKMSVDLEEDDLRDLYTNMWIYAHGIAWLIANGTCNFTDEQISKMIGYQFQARMLLEQNPDNPWTLDKYHNTN